MKPPPAVTIQAIRAAHFIPASLPQRRRLF
jgi:hypothetical protein